MESSPTGHEWAGSGSHCSNIWGACECVGQRAYWWVCLLAPPDIYQTNRKCQWMPDVSSGYDATLEKPELLIHSLPPLTQFTSPFTLPLHLSFLSPPPLPLFSSRPPLCGATGTCQSSDLNNGSHAHSGWNCQHLRLFLSCSLAVFMLEKNSPVLHEWDTFYTIRWDELCMLSTNALSPTWIRQASDGKLELTFPALTHNLAFLHPQREVL